MFFIRVYILDMATKGVSMFDHSGSGPGCFKDPAGLAVDRLSCNNLRRKCAGSVSRCSMGNMLIADSRNHRLCLHDFKGRFLTEVNSIFLCICILLVFLKLSKTSVATKVMRRLSWIPHQNVQVDCFSTKRTATYTS